MYILLTSTNACGSCTCTLSVFFSKRYGYGFGIHQFRVSLSVRVQRRQVRDRIALQRRARRHWHRHTRRRADVQDSGRALVVVEFIGFRASTRRRRSGSGARARAALSVLKGGPRRGLRQHGAVQLRVRLRQHGAVQQRVILIAGFERAVGVLQSFLAVGVAVVCRCGTPVAVAIGAKKNFFVRGGGVALTRETSHGVVVVFPWPSLQPFHQRVVGVY